MVLEILIRWLRRREMPASRCDVQGHLLPKKGSGRCSAGLPVDCDIPGCPPNPLQFLMGIQELIGKIVLIKKA